jgi:uncharacterized protein YecA (UPF0149 family)
LYPKEVLEDIERAFRDDLVDESSIDLPWVVERLALEKEEVLDDARRDSHHRFVRDTVRELEWWACFDAPEEPAELETKVGRNEPCPCGSGEKYKYCCGARH